jgi:hypothetical protein
MHLCRELKSLDSGVDSDPRRVVEDGIWGVLTHLNSYRSDRTADLHRTAMRYRTFLYR